MGKAQSEMEIRIDCAAQPGSATVEVGSVLENALTVHSFHREEEALCQIADRESAL